MAIAAIILAGGLSSRMEGFKPIMRLGSMTLLEHCATLFRRPGIGEIIVVAGHRADDVIAEARLLGCRSVCNPRYRDGMFSSIQAGVSALRDHCRAFFLLPVDIPLVQPTTVERLMKAFAEDPGVPVYYPAHRSRRGHPPLISTALTAAIEDYAGEGGMRGLLGHYERHAQTIAVDDQGILLDADTREQFSALARIATTSSCAR